MIVIDAGVQNRYDYLAASGDVLPGIDSVDVDIRRPAELRRILQSPLITEVSIIWRGRICFHPVVRFNVLDLVPLALLQTVKRLSIRAIREFVDLRIDQRKVLYMAATQRFEVSCPRRSGTHCRTDRPRAVLDDIAVILRRSAGRHEVCGKKGKNQPEPV